MDIAAYSIQNQKPIGLCFDIRLMNKFREFYYFIFHALKLDDRHRIMGLPQGGPFSWMHQPMIILTFNIHLLVIKYVASLSVNRRQSDCYNNDEGFFYIV